MEKIKETIAGIMQDLAGKKEGTPSESPEVLLKNTLTNRERQHIKFKYFKKGVMGVAVDSSSWLYNFTLKKEHLLSQLRYKTDKIKDIRFRLG